MITWRDSHGIEHDIKSMPTNYIENCLAFIDERILTLVRRVSSADTAREELSTKRAQKKEMMRVLHERKARPQPTVYSCMSCKHSDTVLNQLICKKLNNFCSAVNFTCGAWERSS